jgi:hypothetical protein
MVTSLRKAFSLILALQHRAGWDYELEDYVDWDEYERLDGWLGRIQHTDCYGTVREQQKLLHEINKEVL